MEENRILCPRCDGRKQMYKMMGGYSHANVGGVKVNCILCLGTGTIKTLETVIKEMETSKNVEEVKPGKRKSVKKDPI